jgi:hypothetical protein
MAKLGYLLSEAPALIFVVWFAIRFFQFRRRQKNQAYFSDSDRQTLFGRRAERPITPGYYLKLSLAILVAASIGALEMVALAPFGAAILTGALLLTSAVIVHLLLPLDL